MATCRTVVYPDSIWDFCANLPAAIFFTVLFGLTTIVHIAQAAIYKKKYSTVIILAGATQAGAYALRSLSIANPANETYYTLWFILLMVSPVLTNAYVYMVMGRMVYNFTSKASIFRIHAWRFGLVFVLLDVAAFFVQLVGLVFAGEDDPQDKVTGINIYMAGIGFQQACIIIFLVLAIRFHMTLLKQTMTTWRLKDAMSLLYVLYAVLALITTRIVFRLVEYSGGMDSKLAKQEAYQYALDSALMFIASILFNIWHPGRIMPGSESDLPSKKIRKGLKKQGLAPPRGRLSDTLSRSNSGEGFCGGVMEMGRDVRGRYEPVQNDQDSAPPLPPRRYN